MSRLSRKDAAKSTVAVWRWLADQGPEVDGNVPELLARLGGVGNVTAPTQLDDRLKLMAHLGLIEREVGSAWEPGEGDKHSFPRTTGKTRIKMSVAEGAQLIARHFANGGFLKVAAKGNQKMLNGTAERPVDPEVVAIRTDEKDEPVEAVVGEEAPNPFAALREMRKSEPVAFIEAARQYEHRQDFVFSKLEEIEKLGVKLDKAKIMAGIDMARDDELEGVVRILPYIDELEAKVKQAQEWRNETISLRNEIRSVRRERDEARTEAQRQKEANKRIVEERVRQPQVLVGG